MGGSCDFRAFFAVACLAEQLQVFELICATQCDGDDVINFDDHFLAVCSTELAS